MEVYVKKMSRLQAEYKAQQESLEKVELAAISTPEYQAYLAKLETVRESKRWYEEERRMVGDYAVEHFDGENKHPHPAITLKEFTVVDYPADRMKAWAIEHNHPGLLNLNASAAKKVATGPTAPEFVSVTKEIRATIKTDLSEYI